MKNVKYFVINLWEAILFMVMPKSWMREYFTIDWNSPQGIETMKRLVKYPSGMGRRFSTLTNDELDDWIIEYKKQNV